MRVVLRHLAPSFEIPDKLWTEENNAQWLQTTTIANQKGGLD